MNDVSGEMFSGEGTWLLRIACMNGDLDLTTHLPAHGADPNLTWSGLTALFDAVRADSIPCVDVLLAAGADINAQDVNGWTCLWSVPSVEMAHHLLAHGADPSIPDQVGNLPENNSSIPASIAHIYQYFRQSKITTAQFLKK